jgi:hypothetical protein
MTNKDLVFGRFSMISMLILIGADLSIEAISAAVASPLLAIPVIGVLFAFFGALAAYFLFAILAGLIVFFIEWQESKNLMESLIEGIVISFLVAIPTPIIGVITALAIGVKAIQK